MEPQDDGQVLLDQDGVSLSAAIELLRAELARAIESGDGKRVRFVPESIELELELAAKMTRKGNGGVDLWKVVTLGGAKEYEGAAKHRLKLVLKPKDTKAPKDSETLVGEEMVRE